MCRFVRQVLKWTQTTASIAARPHRPAARTPHLRNTTHQYTSAVRPHPVHISNSCPDHEHDRCLNRFQPGRHTVRGPEPNLYVHNSMQVLATRSWCMQCSKLKREIHPSHAQATSPLAVPATGCAVRLETAAIMGPASSFLDRRPTSAVSSVPAARLQLHAGICAHATRWCAVPYCRQSGKVTSMHLLIW